MSDPNYKALLEEALYAYSKLDKMLDAYMDAHGADLEETNQSRGLYKRIAAIHRALGRDFQDIPLDNEDEEEAA